MSPRLSMPNRLAAILLCFAFQTHAGITANAFRRPGAPLDPSLKNEADHAASQASLWLVARQAPDGSWGTTNRVKLTSLALLALAVAGQAETSDACARAALWLDAHATNRLDRLDDHAWRLLACSFVLPDTPARPHLLARFVSFAQPLVADAPTDARRLWSEAQAAAGLAPDAPPDASEPTDAKARLPRTWPPETSDNAELWLFAHLINRHLDGQLVREGAPLDWRRDLAQILINAQRRDPAGGGYWDAPVADAKLAQTAFGLLLLQEL